MARGRTCPPGVFCVSDTFFLLLIIVGILLVIGWFMKSPNPTIILPPATTTVVQGQGDGRFSQAPQPLRDWMAPPEFPPRGGIATIPINIPTQGLPESFQSVGLVKVGDQLLPLYGRRTMNGSDRWNYYTRTDSYNPIPLPVQFQKRDCMDGVGCQEIISGDPVKIDGLQKEGKANIYRFDGPKYIPGMI